MNAGHDETSRIAQLNDLLQLDHDAVEAYTVAIDLVRDPVYRETLVRYRADHKRHIEELAALVRQRGGLPTEMPHPTGALKLLVQGIGGTISDDSLLLAFKTLEGQTRDKYERASRQVHPADVAAVIQRAFADEDAHYRWAEQTLRERGVGAGTMQHRVANAVQTAHKVLADSVEAVERKVMEGVGSVVGTTRRRGGSVAPSPADAAAGMSSAPDGKGTAPRPEGPAVPPVRDPGIDPLP